MFCSLLIVYSFYTIYDSFQLQKNVGNVKHLFVSGYFCNYVCQVLIPLDKQFYLLFLFIPQNKDIKISMLWKNKPYKYANNFVPVVYLL